MRVACCGVGGGATEQKVNGGPCRGAGTGEAQHCHVGDGVGRHMEGEAREAGGRLGRGRPVPFRAIVTPFPPEPV